MASLGKRSRSTRRGISPPPLHRKLEHTSSEDQRILVTDLPSQPTQSLAPFPSNSSDLLRIFSWNVNGIAPFLQKPTTSFFTPRQEPSAFISTTTPLLDATPYTLRSFLYPHHEPLPRSRHWRRNRHAPRPQARLPPPPAGGKPRVRSGGMGWMVVLVGDVNIARGPLDGCPGMRLGEEQVKGRRDFNARFCSAEEGAGGMGGVDVWR